MLVPASVPILARRPRRAAPAFACVLVLSSLPSLSSADWDTDLQATAFVDSNLGYATAGPNRHAADGARLDLSTGPEWDLASGTTALTTLGLHTDALDRYGSQDNCSLEAAAHIDRKLGLGRRVPHLYADVSVARLQWRDSVRDGWRYRLGAGLRGSPLDRLALRGEAGYEHRTGDHDDVFHAGVPGNVFDQNSRSLALGADVTLTPRWLLVLGASFGRGDADYIDTAAPGDRFDDVNAVTADPGFGPGVVVERLKVRTLTLDWGLSFALGDHASINAGLRRQLASSESGETYARSMPSIGIQYRFD